jgi:uncharacterized protein
VSRESDVSVSEVEGGIQLPVRVVPRASKTALDGSHDGSLRVRVNAPPVDGAANKALCEFLAKIFNLRKRDVRIVRGERSRDKIVLLVGATRATVLEVLG